MTRMLLGTLGLPLILVAAAVIGVAMGVGQACEVTGRLVVGYFAEMYG